MTLDLKRESWSAQVDHILAGQKVAVEVVVRRGVVPRAILVCLTGGGVTRAFFDLRCDEDASFSLVEAMAARGYCVVLIDHLGTGGSTTPEDGYTLTPDRMADANAAAARTAIDFIRAGGCGGGACAPPVFGIGHSMGAMLTVLIQARHSLYQGLVLLGYVANGAPRSLRPSALAAAGDPARIRADLQDMTAEMFGEAIKFVAPRRPDDAPRGTRRRMSDEVASRLFRAEAADPAATLALKGALAPVVNVSTLFAIIPGSHLPEMAVVRVPIIVIVGAYDFAFPPRDLDQLFPNAPSIEAFLPDGVGHNIVNFPGRGEVFARIGAWLEKMEGQSCRAGAEASPEGG